MGKQPREGGGRDIGKGDKSPKPVEQPRRAPAVKVATPKARDAEPLKQGGRSGAKDRAKAKRDISVPGRDVASSVTAKEQDRHHADRRDIREKGHHESSSTSRSDKGLGEARTPIDKREPHEADYQRDIRAKQLAELGSELEPIAFEEGGAELKTDEVLAADVVQTQLAILRMWKNGLDVFDKVMTSATDAESHPDFKTGIKDFLQKRVLGELNGVIGELMSRPKLPGVGDALSLLGSLEAEVTRAMDARKSASLRDFVVDYSRAFARLDKEMSTTQADFATAVQLEREAMETAEAVQAAEGDDPGAPRTTLAVTREADQYGLLRASLVETAERLNAISDKTTPEHVFRTLCEEWINRSVMSGPMGHDYPAEVRIYIRPDYSVVRAQIHAPRGQEIADQLLRDSPDGVDVFGLKVRRRIVVLGAQGSASSVLRLDPDGRVFNDGTFAENGGHGLQPLLSARGLERTKALSGGGKD